MTSNSTENGRRGVNRRRLLMVCLMAVFGSIPASAQTPAAACIEPVQWQVMMQELRNLRIELLHERIERTTARIAELQQQLHSAEAARTAVDDLERSQAEEIAEFQARLFEPGLPQQERSEIERHRLEMMTTGSRRLAERKTAAAGRQGELQRQLAIYQQQRLQLLEALRVLEGASPRQP